MSHHSFSMDLKGAQYQSQVWRLRKYTGCDSDHCCQVTPPHHLQQYGFNSIKLCPDLGVVLVGIEGQTVRDKPQTNSGVNKSLIRCQAIIAIFDRVKYCKCC